MKTTINLLLLSLIVLNFSCKNNTEESHADVVENEPLISNELSKTVIDHHLNAFLANDIEALLVDYTEESVIITPDTLVRGLEPIKGLLETFIQAFPTEGTTIEIDTMIIDNDLVFIKWHGRTPSLVVSYASDTFVIRNSKIMQQTFAGVLNPVQKAE